MDTILRNIYNFVFYIFDIFGIANATNIFISVVIVIFFLVNISFAFMKIYDDWR